MACEDIELATILAKTIKSISKDLISSTYWIKNARGKKKLDMKIACEIFADRNYEDDGISIRKTSCFNHRSGNCKTCFNYGKKSVA